MKFRGKRKDNGKEVKGYYFKIKDKHYIIPDDARILPLGYTLGPPTLDGFIEVIPSSIAMSTTVLDKNNKEIYGSIPIDGEMTEGKDRVKLNEHGPICEIRWQQEYARWICSWDDPEDGPSYVLLVPSSDIEIIQEKNK